jgi:tetratricopeptide (TPR) repeat protein
MWIPIILALGLLAAYFLLRRVTSWRREIARALRLERDGRTDVAESILQEVVRASKSAPGSLRYTAACFHLGAFLMRAHRFREAMEQLREPLAARLDTENELTIRSMIRTALEAQGLADLADDEERRMSELVSNIQDASLQAEWRGQLLLEQARPDEAAEQFRSSVERVPPRQLGRVVGRALKAANACLLAGRYEDGAGAARRTIELRPPPLQMAMACSILASACMSMGNLDEAESAAREARRRAEEAGDEHLRAHSLRQLATLSLLRGEYDRAEAAAKGIEEIDAPKAELHFLQGEIMRHRGEFDAALVLYDRALEEAEEHYTGYALANLKASSLLAASWAEFERGDSEAALARCEGMSRIRRVFPMLARDAAAQRAIYLAALGRAAESEKQMEEALAQEVQLPDSRHARIARASFSGLHHLLMGRPKRAAEELRAALAESPPPKDRPRLELRLGRALEAAGDEQGARQEFEKAAAGPRGDAYSQIGREELARYSG